MAKSKRSITFTLDTYLSILAVVASFCAIGITFYQAYLQRMQQYASVRPVLDSYHTGRFEANTPGSAIVIANFGLGPAFIDSVQYYYGDKRYPNMYMLIHDALAAENRSDSSVVVSDLWNNKIIPQGETVELYKTSNPNVLEQLYRLRGRIKTVIYYRSIYDEHWVFDNRKTDQDRIRKLD